MVGLAMPRPLIILALVVAGVSLPGCGGTGSGSEGSADRPVRVTVVLDYLPNAVHAGIARAQQAGYYRERGLDLRVISPTSTSDTLRLIDSGRALIGLADGIDIAQQIDRGEDAQAILAIVQRPLGGVISLERSGIMNPRELEGKEVGVTGVPSDSAVLDTVVASDGGEPSAVREVTVGFGGVQALENGRIDAFVGYYPADGVQVARSGRPVRVFALDEHGGPQYPGLVAFSTRKAIAGNRELLLSFVEATAEGYEDTVRDQRLAVDSLMAEHRGLDRGLVAAQLEAYVPLFVAGADRFGQITPAAIRGLSRFLVGRGLIDRPIAPSRYYDGRLVSGR